MITKEQAQEQLAFLGIDGLPDFMLEALVARANSINECLNEHYDAATALMIQVYLLGLFTLAQTQKYISSQTAPSGASQSFRWNNLSDAWRGLTGLIKGLDPYGCTAGLIPADPTKKAYAGVWVSTPNKCGG